MTSTWIPLALLAALCAYMIHLFRLERREALAFSGAETVSPAPAVASSGGGHDAGHGAPAADAAHSAPAPAPAHAPAAHVEPAPKKKRPLIWRGWAMRIWVPLLLGIGGQAYLDLIKPLVEKAAH
jgi:hypothetical protein